MLLGGDHTHALYTFHFDNSVFRFCSPTTQSQVNTDRRVQKIKQKQKQQQQQDIEKVMKNKHPIHIWKKISLMTLKCNAKKKNTE